MNHLAVHVVTPFGTHGGAEQWLLDLIDHAPGGMEWRATVLADGPVAAGLRSRGVGTDVLPTGRYAWSIAGAALRLVAGGSSGPVDVLLANGVKAAAVALPAGRLLQVPVVWAKHDFAHDRLLGARLGRRVDAVVAVSEAVARATGRDDTVLAPPTTTADPVPPGEAADVWRRHGVPLGDGRTVAMVARRVPLKGIEDAVAALATWAARDWRLVVVGGDDPAAPGHGADLAALATDLGVADRVHLVGWVPDAARWLAAFDAVAVLTRVDASGFGREGFGLTALEALRAGVPLVAADGNPEVVRLAQRAGHVVRPGDPVAVGQALASLAAHRPSRAQLMAVAAEHPGPDEVAARVARVLRAAAHPHAVVGA